MIGSRWWTGFLVGLVVAAAIAFGAYHLGRDSIHNASAASAGLPVYDTMSVISATQGHASEAHPTRIPLSVDSARFLQMLSWQSWGGQQARGHGILGIDNCQPDCASGSHHWQSATVVLSNIGMCKGLRAYRDISVNGSNPSSLDLTDQCPGSTS